LYFNFFSASFCTTVLSAGIATSISVHVFLLLLLLLLLLSSLGYLTSRFVVEDMLQQTGA
jgi:hypothetical protein